MDRRDQQAISDLFAKLDDVERRSPPRDAEADRYIRDAVARQPGAPYYMAQTIVVQEQALAAAEARIRELEDEVDSRSSSGGLFGGLFGGGSRRGARYDDRRRRGQEPAFDDQRYGRRYGGGGGGFLAGAAQTAMGVAGGVLLGNAIAGMFDGGAEAATDTFGQADHGQGSSGEESGFLGWGGDDDGDFGGGDDI